MNVEEFVEFAKKYLGNANLNYDGEAIYSKKETFEEKERLLSSWFESWPISWRNKGEL